jgi:hypothetical protein
MRLGAGPRGYNAVKEIFNNLDWEKLRTNPPISPLLRSANAVYEDMIHIGVEQELVDTFSEEYHGDEWAKAVRL